MTLQSSLISELIEILQLQQFAASKAKTLQHGCPPCCVKHLIRFYLPIQTLLRYGCCVLEDGALKVQEQGSFYSFKVHKLFTNSGSAPLGRSSTGWGGDSHSSYWNTEEDWQAACSKIPLLLLLQNFIAPGVFFNNSLMSCNKHELYGNTATKEFHHTHEGISWSTFKSHAKCGFAGHEGIKDSLQSKTGFNRTDNRVLRMHCRPLQCLTCEHKVLWKNIGHFLSYALKATDLSMSWSRITSTT